MSLDIAVRHRRGDFALDVAFHSEARITALFGPSGSGKSTILNVIAGLIMPEEAHVAVDGRVLLETKADVVVPVHRRRVGYVFQDARLFPHLSVAGNLTYSRRFTPRSERYGSVDEIVDLLGLRPLLDRKPATLSGGEKQRVAIGRALLASPRLLLMDEPLASLDAARKAETLPYLERLRDELAIPMVYVSHSLEEVQRLTDAVVRLDRGQLAHPLPFAPAPPN
jgi:molybdate transport system ATP-binding protein